MILHPYSHGDVHIANYYGYGFGSIFARLFSKVAAKTASRAALSVALRVGSRLVKTGMKKIIPVAKKTVSLAKKGMKKAVPVAKKMVKKGVKRAAEEAQNLIANKVRKVEEIAINKGVPPKVAHSLSTLVEEGSHTGIDSLGRLADNESAKVINTVVSEARKSIQKQPVRAKKIKHRVYLQPRKTGKKRKQKIAYDIQNLIDSA